jgi:flavin-dependent dehydrogenase
MSGEGVPYAWLLCSIAAEELGRAMKDGAYPFKQSAWLTNARYAEAQGADFAQTLAMLPGALKCSPQENDYEFKQGIIFEDDDEKGKGNMIAKLLKGVLSGGLSFKTLSDLIKAVTTGGKIRKHYLAFPKTPDGFEKWKTQAIALWSQAENIADLAERDLAQMEKAK